MDGAQAAEILSAATGLARAAARPQQNRRGLSAWLPKIVFAEFSFLQRRTPIFGNLTISLLE